MPTHESNEALACNANGWRGGRIHRLISEGYHEVIGRTLGGAFTGARRAGDA